MSEVFSRVEREMTWWICYPKASYVFRVSTDEGQLVVLVAPRPCIVGKNAMLKLGCLGGYKFAHVHGTDRQTDIASAYSIHPTPVTQSTNSVDSSVGRRKHRVCTRNDPLNL